MAFLDNVFSKIFSKQLANQQQVGSDVFAAMLEYIGKGNPVYMGDNTESYIRNGYLFNPTVYS